MDQSFRQAFEKTAKVNLLNTIAKSTWGRGGAMRSGSGVLATPAPTLAKPAAKSAVPARTLRSPTNSHTDYLRSIGAIGKANPNEGKILKYAPSKNNLGKTSFESITDAPKTKIAPERGPLK